jgi:hypothetical protein
MVHVRIALLESPRTSGSPSATQMSGITGFALTTRPLMTGSVSSTVKREGEVSLITRVEGLARSAMALVASAS